MSAAKHIGIVLLGFGFTLGTLSVAKATVFSDYSSSSQVDPNLGSSVADDAPTASSSSVSLDANDFAKSFITPGTSIMGAAVSGNGSIINDARTQTVHDDSWWFNCDAKHICETTGTSTIPVRVSFGIKVTETKVTGGAFLEFQANYSLQNSGSFSFYFAQDGLDDFELSADYRSASGQRTDLSGDVQTTLSDGVYTLTLSKVVQDSVCGITVPCVPMAMSCSSGEDCSPTPAFTDTQKISALIDASAGEQDLIDGYDPFSVDIVSLDPNYQFISADGRTIGNAPITAVPEPASLIIFGGALAALGVIRRGKRT